jgi:hypothetical protein
MRPGDDPPTPRESGLATAALDALGDFDAGPLSQCCRNRAPLARGSSAARCARPADTAPLRHAGARTRRSARSGWSASTRWRHF